MKSPSKIGIEPINAQQRVLILKHLAKLDVLPPHVRVHLGAAILVDLISHNDYAEEHVIGMLNLALQVVTEMERAN